MPSSSTTRVGRDPTAQPGRRERSPYASSDDNRRQVVSILDWAEKRFGHRLKSESFSDLFTETDCEAMMMSFSQRLSASQLNKSRQRFWRIADFAKRRPFQVRWPFGPEDVQQFGGVENNREREIPSVKMIQTILKAARERERLWIWLGIGLGFGNDDLARACPVYFDKAKLVSSDQAA